MTKIPPLVISCIATQLAFSQSSPNLPQQSPELPNVIMVMADDLGWSDFASYRLQQGLTPVAPTPNVDRLVAGGMMFTDAHSPASVCAPTRFSMITGSSPVRNGQERGTWSFTDLPAVLRNREHTTVGDVLQNAGYRTSMYGKMHLGGGDSFNHNNPRKIENTFPTSYGFDYSFLVHDGIQGPPYIYFENDEFVRVDPNNQSRMGTTGSASDIFIENSNGPNVEDIGPNGIGRHSTRAPGTTDNNWNSSQNGIINSDKAVEFIDNHLTNYPERPFMLYYCTPQIHGPQTPPIDFEPDANGNPHNPPRVPVAGITASTQGGGLHADMVYEFDLQIGKIIAKLEDPNGDGNTDDSILADTLIMITSDNGGLPTSTANYETTGVLRESKSYCYEGGHRVPFIAHWGDGTVAGSTIAPGTISDQIIGAHDWVPTMYALTGQDVADLDAMDSVNILPVLLGEQDENDPIRPFLLHQGNKEGMYGIRRGDYVLIMNDNRVAIELYNLKDDLEQTTDLIDPSNYPNNVVPQDILALADELETLYNAHNDVNEPRSTIPYDVDGYTIPPQAVDSTTVSMTARPVQGIEGPYEYRFIESSGNLGGADSNWQRSNTYVNTGLLPSTLYTYRVEVRNASGEIVLDSNPDIDVLTPSRTTLFQDNFNRSGGTTEPDNILASDSNPQGTWFMKDTDNVAANENPANWATEEANANSANIDHFVGAASDFQMRLGFSFDEVRVLYNTGVPFVLSENYTLSGDWIINASQHNHLGFVAGIAEFDSSGNLVQTLGLSSNGFNADTQNIFGNLSSNITDSDTGDFSVTVTASELANAGVVAGNSIGVYFSRDDDGILGIDSNSRDEQDRNDVYLIDNVSLTNSFDLNFGDDISANITTSGSPQNQASVTIPSEYLQDGRLYILEHRKELTSESWRAVDAFSATASNIGADYSFPVDTTDVRGFFRIRVE